MPPEACPPALDGEQAMLRTPRLVTGQAVGAGYFIALIVLEQVNAMIEGFLTVSLPAAA